MNLLYIKGSSVNPDISQEANHITTLLFESSKFKGKIQEFVDGLVAYEFDGIIIPVDLDPSLNRLGLEISIRVRLSQDTLGQKALSSIFIFHSQSPVEILKGQILDNTNPTASIFFTEGIFSFDDAFSIKFLIENKKNYNVLGNSNFKSGFLEVIQIKKSPDFGNHSIANLWGVNRLAEVTGQTELLQSYVDSSDQLKEKKADLYFKFLTSQNLTSKNSAQKTINATGRNILLIDDESDKGWAVILKSIFRGANFEFIPPTKNLIDEARLKIKDKIGALPKWDLILLDLRLDENEYQGENAFKIASEYTGSKILNDIKSDNSGTQVIMFTASNKAWNMRELLHMGADGFYIKESPEYGYDLKFSENNYRNFEMQIKNCFENDYLRTMFSYAKDIKLFFSNNPLVKYFPNGLTQLKGIQYQMLLLNELETILEILNTNNANKFNHCLLMQFKILECIAEIFIAEKRGDDLIFWDSDVVKFYSSRDRNLLNRTATVSIKGVNEKIPKGWYESTGNKIHALLSQKLSISLTDPIHDQVDSLVSHRNKFIHPKDRIGLALLNKNNIVEWMDAIRTIISKL